MGLANTMFIPFCCLLIVGNVRPEVLSHSQALAMVQGAGISVTSTGGCSNRNNAQCTSLEGIHREAIDGIITLKRASGCPIIITGGTETGHGDYPGRSHKNGWKIDIRKRGEDCVTRYIKSNFAKISATRWRAPSGNIYFNEVNHWDIQYGNRAKRDVFADQSGEGGGNNSEEDQHNHIAKRWAQQEKDDDGQQLSRMDGLLPNTNAFLQATQELEQINEEFGLNRSRAKRSAMDDCLQCICQVESGCRPLPCKWDVNSMSCGYFQIKKEYYIDCYKPGHRSGESVENSWKRCAADYSCSVQCIQNYVNRFGFKCGGGVGPCQKMARLHNGGPSGCSKSATNRYWNRVYSCLP